MKAINYTLSLLICLSLNSQIPIDTTNTRMITMADTYQKPYAVGGIYYENGSKTPFTGILYGVYNNGELQTIQEFKNGIGNGKWINYDPDGKIECEGTYINNKVEGPIIFYYENGRVKSKGQYVHWKNPIGKWTYYDREGNIVHEVIYTR